MKMNFFLSFFLSFLSFSLLFLSFFFFLRKTQRRRLHSRGMHIQGQVPFDGSTAVVLARFLRRGPHNWSSTKRPTRCRIEME